MSTKKGDTIDIICLACSHAAMASDPAGWHGHMTADERDDLALSKGIRDAAAEQVRNLTARLKARCVKRMKRAQARGAKPNG